MDFTLKREFYLVARRIIEGVLSGEVKAYISTSIVHIAGYWLSKYYGTPKAKELLLTLLADIQIIDVDHETTIRALHSKVNDIEDALQYYTALHHKLDFFISRDKNFQKSSVPILPVLSPQEFLKMIDE